MGARRLSLAEFAVLAFLLLALGTARAGERVLVAVAANFHVPAEALAERFEAQTGHRVTLSVGSTAKHYAQILRGAPYDVFLAADVERPQRLEREGAVVPGSRFTYALGRLVLWSSEPGRPEQALRALRDGRVGRLAIANPRLAPYGTAAEQALRALGVWDTLQSRLVVGEDVGQSYQFVASGNADYGLIALSQLRRPGEPVRGMRWLVPASLYPPIAQQAVLLNDESAARAFLEFLRTPAARALIRSYGYDLPEH